MVGSVKWYVLWCLAFLLVAGLFVTGCSSQAPAPAAAVPAAPTSAARATVASAPTAAAAPTAGPAATVAPAPAATSAPAARKPAGNLVIALQSLGNENFMPHLAPVTNGIYLNAVYDSLMYSDPLKAWPLQPGLAKAWRMAADGLSWTFDLRDDVKFSNGYDFTADDVKFSLELHLRPDAVSSSAVLLKQLVDRIEVVNPHQVVVRLKSPQPAFDLWLADAMYTHEILSKRYVDEVGLAKAEEKPIGTGPFKLAERKSGDSMTFEAVENHWRAVPDFKTVTFKIAPDDSSRLAMLLTGQADLGPVAVEQKAQVEASKGMKIVRFTQAGGPWVVLGGQWLPTRKNFDPKAPWLDKKVRMALNTAINRDEIAQSLYRGEGQPLAVPVILPGSVGYDPNWKPYPYDPTGARKLLAEAGFANGFDLKLVSFPVVPHATADEISKLAQTLGMYWEKIGVRTKIEQMSDYTAYRPHVMQRDNPGEAFIMVLPSYPEPGPVLKSMFDSSGSLQLAAEDPRIDAVFKTLGSEMNAQTRASLVSKVGQIIYDEYFTVPTVYRFKLWALSGKLANWTVPLAPQVNMGIEYMKRAP